MKGFFSEWFGSHAGREFGNPERWFTEKPEDLEKHIENSTKKGLPCYCSVQPYRERDQPFGLEKMFYDFDSEKNTSKAWKEVLKFAETLIKYYKILPFITFSGNKGYHVYVFLDRVVSFQTFQIGFAKKVYMLLQKKLLKGLDFETLDSAILGDIKRLARLPFSIHEKTGKMCSPLSLSHVFIKPKNLEIYKEYSLDTNILEKVCKELKAEEKWHKHLSETRVGFKSLTSHRVRPCIKVAVSLPLNHGEGHKMRLAIVAEYLKRGSSVDQIIDLFRGQKDFNERKTRYFVEDAQHKGYKPFKCKTIKELGFCIKNECKIYKRR
jgi:hypothetical protein